MRKNILIFRSASYEVIFNLIDYILQNNQYVNIYIIIQKESIKILEDKYPDINYIVNENGFFKYNNYLENFELRNNVECRKYDEVYIPSSTREINSFYEIQSIISKIRNKRTFFFNSLGEIKRINTNTYYLKIINVLKMISIYILNILLLFALTSIQYICLIISKVNMKNKEGTLYDR